MLGGDLATAISSSERDLIQEVLIGPRWCFLGGLEETQGKWQSISGDSIDMSLFTSGQPDNDPGQDKVAICRNDGMHDGPSCTDLSKPWNYVIEWSADCNGDSIVDYGQILEGTCSDGDGNGVPDCCEAPASATSMATTRSARPISESCLRSGTPTGRRITPTSTTTVS